MDPRLDEQALRRLLAAGRGLVSDLDLDSVLERVLDAALEITGARYAALGVLSEDRSALQNFIHSGIDSATAERIGDLPRGRGVLGILIDDPRPLRLDDVSADPHSFGFPPGHPPMKTFLGAPIRIRGVPWGNLYLTEKAGGAPFDEEDQAAVEVLAEWASIAIGNARSVAAERLRLTLEAAEQERLQWARELHDETLQGLAAIRLILAGGRRGSGADLMPAVDRSLEQIDHEITALRSLINDLRPDSLDQLGLDAALEGLAARVEARTPGLAIGIAGAVGSEPPLPPEVATAAYRIAQEAITNAVRHGGATAIRIELGRGEAHLGMRVLDDGAGFDPDDVQLGFGILGMRERAELAGGVLVIDSKVGGSTVVTVSLPLG